MSSKRNPHSIGNEPQYRPLPPQSDARELPIKSAGATPDSPEMARLNSVWNEPSFSPPAAKENEAARGPYAQWLTQSRDSTSWFASWGTVLAVAMVSGPLAIVTAFWGAGQTVFSVVALTIFGPLIEEMGKIMALLMVVEKRPFLMRHPLQIFVCAACSGLAFAAIENWIYFNVYIPTPAPELVRWRWTVCVALHVACTLIASVGVARIWQDVWRRQGLPQVELGVPYWVAAIVVHGAYNGWALLDGSWESP